MRATTRTMPSTSPLLPRLAALFASLFVASAVATAQTSSFGTTAEGWVGVTLPFPAPGAPPTELGSTITAPWNATGGNPGGCLRVVDPDGSQPIGHVQYWKAPPSYLGDKSAWLGGQLRYDVKVQTALGNFAQEDVLLTGNGITLAWFANQNPSSNVWTTFTVPLQAAAWRVGTRTGPVATPAELASVLSSLSSVYLRGEFQNGVDILFLDNVEFSAPATVTPFGSGCAGSPTALVLTASSLPVLGTTYTQQASTPLAASLGLFLHATTAIPGGVDLTFLGLDGCTLYVNLEVLSPAAVAAGSFTAALPLPNDTAFLGLHLYSQAALLAPLNPFGMVTSNALDATLGQ